LGQQFDIRLTVRQAQRRMHQLGYRLKRAGYSYLQASSAEARQFQRTSKKQLRNLGPRETVVFEDETGFTCHPRLGFGWAKRGRRLKVPTSSNHHKRLNLFDWVAPLLGRVGLTPTPGGNREGFLACLQSLHRRLRGYTIWLYIHGAGRHKGEEDIESIWSTVQNTTHSWAPRKIKQLCQLC
jgi:hypothetical protein